MDFLELEAVVGRAWHRWAAAAASYPSHPHAAVAFDEVRGRLAVFFRGLGGAGGVRLVAGAGAGSGHRLRLRQRLGLGGGERLPQPTLDAEALTLPERIDCFAERDLNAQLYFWLAAFFAHAPAAVAQPDDALRADLAQLRAAHAATCATLAAWPGLRPLHARLCEAVRAVRPERALPPSEAAVEDAILHLLGAPAPRKREIVDAIATDAPPRLRAPRGYRRFLPVPLWGEIRENRRGAPSEPGDGPAGEAAEAQEERRLKARRRRTDQAARRDSLILHRFEYLLSVAEMVNVNREMEDDDPASARQTAATLDELTLGSHGRRPASRLKLDLELAPAAVEARPLAATLTYPEWDFTRGCYHADHCRVVAGPAAEEGDDWIPDAAARRRIRAVKRQFEALRPRREVQFAQTDGDELDLDALIRSQVDLRVGAGGSDRVWLQTREAARDLAVAVLMDASLSTDSWVANRRVLDVEKEAVLALGHGLAACGDEHAIFAFTSRTRRQVSVLTIKDFGEALNARVARRLQALRPGHYTRIGAALRHAAARLVAQPNRRRLLLVITDGKPNDMDHYEGRYGAEDTRRAVREARRVGLAVFGITVDSRARDYFPHLFGPGGYAMVGRIARLPAALPAIYRQLTG